MQKETYEMMEKVLQDKIKEMSEDIITPDKEKLLMSEIKTLNECLGASDQRAIDFLNKEEDRKIEREKNELTWSKIGMEILKTFGPLSLSMLGYNIFQRRVIKFEETGRLVSSASRELHLPKFFRDR